MGGASVFTTMSLCPAWIGTKPKPFGMAAGMQTPAACNRTIYGLEALARYMTKEPNGGKRWAASKNLVEPKITEADTKISRRKVEQMAEDFEAKPAAIFAALFPEYSFNECAVRYSDFVAGAYIYAKLHRKAAPPQKQKKKRRVRNEHNGNDGNLPRS